MTTRLWFLVQLAPRFAANNTLTRRVNLPLLARCNGNSKLWYSEHKPRSPQIESGPAAADTLNQAGWSSDGNTAPHTKSNPIMERNLAIKRKANFRTKEVPNQLIWEGHRIRTKSGLPPKKTRKQCKRNSKKAISGSPCCVCANDIEITYQDVALLHQFLCPFTGKVLDAVKTGLCRQQQKKLVVAISKARDFGLLQFTVPRPDVRQS